jgi:hypothetical protein
LAARPDLPAEIGKRIGAVAPVYSSDIFLRRAIRGERQRGPDGL